MERTYRNEEDKEHWQDVQGINFKLWQITTLLNLKQIQEEFSQDTVEQRFSKCVARPGARVTQGEKGGN